MLPGSMFLLVGLWHTLNSITNYVENPKAFRARVWHPVRCFSGKTRCLELYILLVGTFTDMCIEFFYSTHLKFTVNGAINTNHLNDFEHAAMLLMFFLFVIVVLISENTRYVTPPFSFPSSPSFLRRRLETNSCGHIPNRRFNFIPIVVLVSYLLHLKVMLEG